MSGDAGPARPAGAGLAQASVRRPVAIHGPPTHAPGPAAAWSGNALESR